MQVKGKITKILEVQKGTSKKGEDWQKIQFVLETDEQYNNLYCFEIFGEEKVENFNKYNKVGQEVEVSFNVSTNEWQGKYFTSLQCWKVFTATQTSDLEAETVGEESEDLPF